MTQTTTAVQAMALLLQDWALQVWALVTTPTVLTLLTLPLLRPQQATTLHHLALAT
jgi:hypothetical protein